MNLSARLNAWERLMRLDKPIGILLLAWPTLWALWVSGGGNPSPFMVWIFMLGTVLMRSAGCVMNDYADRNFDGHVERTKNRPLATGEVSTREALLLAAGLSLCAFILILPLHRLVIALSFAAFFLAASYPFTKRFFAIPQAYLGIAFGFGAPMAYAAQLYEVPFEAWLLLAANVFWAVAYDTEYALVDREDDLKIGIRTSAITLGRADVAAVMLFYGLYLAIWSWAALQAGLGGAFWLGIAVAAAQVAWHFTLIRHRSREGCFRAFRENHWVGFAVFAGYVLDLALR